MPRTRNFSSIGLQLLVIVLFLVVWEIVADTGLVNSLFLAPPSAVVRDGGSAVQLISANFVITFYEVVIALFLAMALGTCSGFLLGFKPALRNIVNPYISLGYSIPKVPFYPLLILAFGFGPSSKIAYGFADAFFPVVLNTAGALISSDPMYYYIANAFGASRSQIYRKVVIPSLRPALLSNFRQALVLSVIGVLVGEMLAPNAGLGYVIVKLSFSFKTSQLYAVVSIISIAIAATNLLLLRWGKSSHVGKRT